MGAMGKYIAALPERARDRLITGQRWIAHSLSDGQGGCCLRGHAEGFVNSGMTQSEISRIRYSSEYVKGMFDGWHDYEAQQMAISFRVAAIGRFNPAFKRWGDRLVRAIKSRAATLNGSSAPEIAALLKGEEVSTG